MSNNSNKSGKPTPKVTVPKIGISTEIKKDIAKGGHHSTTPPPKDTKPKK